MSADRHLHHSARTLALRSMSPRLIVAILDARIGPFTPGMIGHLSTATGAPVVTIKKAWELKDSGMVLCAQSAGQLPKSRLWKRWLEQLPGADLEAKERDRCANLASRAVAAGLAERTVRIAERQGQLMVEMGQAALREVDLSPEQASAFKAALARQARGVDCAILISSTPVDAVMSQCVANIA